MKNSIPYNVLKNPNAWENAPRGAVATAVGGALGFSTTTLFGSAAITFGTITISTASVVGYLITTAITSWALSALEPRPDTSSLQGILVNAREATASRS